MANNTKQQAINTFTGGLNTDLHPLTTPNDILTDCINGTVITYNGNEYILQNDMGNYQLKKAQLPADYIPVGIKEYGNIIYIVSYNPIDKKCQIGSYPSPQTLFDNTPRPSKNSSYHGIKIHELSESWTWNEEGSAINPENTTDVLFTKYSPNQNLIVLFPEKGDLEDTYLSPGDKYWLYVSDKQEKNQWKFQKSKYYTLTESKEVYEIEETVEEKSTDTIIDEEMPYVKWEVPGWLGYKPTLFNLDSFNIYLTDIKLPSFLTTKTEENKDSGILSFSIQGQATLPTDAAWATYYKDLKVLFEYKSNKIDSSWIELGRIRSQEIQDGKEATNYGNKIDVLTYNISSKEIFVSNEDKIITVRATPYLINNGEGIVYDNFRVEYQINLNDLYNLTEIKVFDTYKYLVSKDEITINFSILSPTVNTKSITCKYSIFSFPTLKDWDTSTSLQVSPITQYFRQDIPSLNLLGQNMLTIPFTQSFAKGNIYIFTLEFFQLGKDTPLIDATKSNILITSELLNEFYSTVDQFQTITKASWIQRLQPKLTVDKISTPYNPNNPIIKSYVKTTFPEDILKYNDSMSIGIYDPNNAEKSRNDAINTLTEMDVTSSIYSGLAYIDKQDLSIEFNPIKGIEGESLWEDMLDKIQITKPKYVFGSKSIEYDPSNWEETTKANPYKFTNINILKVNAFLDFLSASTQHSREGTRIYLNERLFQKFNSNTFGSPFYPGTGGSANWNLSKLNGSPLKSQKEKDIYSYAYLKDWGKRHNGETVAMTINIAARGDGLFYINESGNNIGKRNLTDSLFYRQYDGNNATVIDNFFNDRTPKLMPFLIPIFLGNYRINSSNLADIGLFFPDGSHSEGKTTFTATGFSIPVLEGNQIFPAAIQFFTNSGYTIAGNREKKWSYYFYDVMETSGEAGKYSANDATIIILALFLAIGMHIYSYNDLKDVSKMKLLSVDQGTEVTSINSGKISLVRNDEVIKINYLNADLLNTDINELSKIIYVDSGSSYNLNLQSLNNLLGTYEKLVKVSNLSSDYENPRDLKLDSEEFVLYKYALAEQLKEIFKRFLEKSTAVNGTVYSDLSEISQSISNREELELILKTFVDSMTYRDTNFYWSAKTNRGIGVYRDGNRAPVLRYINFSDILSKYSDILSRVITPLRENVSTEFKKLYGN